MAEFMTYVVVRFPHLGKDGIVWCGKRAKSQEGDLTDRPFPKGLSYVLAKEREGSTECDRTTRWTSTDQWWTA